MLHLSQHLFAFVSCLKELGSLLPLKISLSGPRSAVDNFKYGLSHWISPSNFWKLYKICKPSFLNQAARLLLDDRQHLPCHRHLARQSSYLGLWVAIVLWARVQLELCSWPSCQEWGPGSPGSLLPAGPGWGIGTLFMDQQSCLRPETAGRLPHRSISKSMMPPDFAGWDVSGRQVMPFSAWLGLNGSYAPWVPFLITWLLCSISRGDSCGSRTTISASQAN